jgi:hypothetical protein
MNNFYLQERMVELKQRDIQYEVEQTRLLKEAGLVNEGWLARAAKALRNVLQARKGGSPDQMTIETKVYPSSKSV